MTNEPLRRRERALRYAIAVAGGIVLALAFPKVDLPWLAPIGLTALFWAWQPLSLKDAFFAGWLGGTAYFLIAFSWFSYTVGAMVGRFSFALVLIPAAAEALAFAVAGLATAYAFRRASPLVAALAGAMAFAAAEWLRSIGFTGVPLAQIGYSQVDTPFAVFAAYVGTFGVTFVVAAVASLAATALTVRSVRVLAVPAIVLAGAWLACWTLWPARHVDGPVMTVAAIQGNIAQSVKWNAKVFHEALDRYSALSTVAAQRHPQLIVWPETSVTTYLDADPVTMSRLSRLAATLRTTLVIGTLTSRDGRDYNSLYEFGPDGGVRSVYDKRQLVPFVEKLPARNVLGALPGAALVGRFENGADDTVWEVGGVRFAPLICWESAFADRTYAQERRGAQALLIATDDAWFGETSGPFQHAQIARMRAIEYGAWVVRAAQTGVSGIIQPDGHWTQRVGMTQAAAVTGSVGHGVGSVFAAVGPTPIAMVLVLGYAACVLVPRRRSRR